MQDVPVREAGPVPAAATGAVVRATGVSKHYGDQVAVADLDLEVPASSIFGFVGPSGAGKTTTIRLLTGVARPSSGEIEVLGRPPATFTPSERARIGYLPQLPVLFPTMSLSENLHFTASIYGMPLRRARRLRAALDLVELWEHRGKRLRDASGGMQRRLALAAALVHDPDLVFLDEPTAGIDPVLRRKLWGRFRELCDEGRTLFVTTQYVGEAEYCDLVAVVDRGRIVAVDTPPGLRRRAFGGEVLEIRAGHAVPDDVLDALHDLPGVVRVRPPGADRRSLRLVVDHADRAIPRVTECVEGRGVALESVHEERPAFDDVFVRLIEDGAR